jgi:MoaA/NifB/PqqE/SkfB family radical SAM enzyme
VHTRNSEGLVDGWVNIVNYYVGNLQRQEYEEIWKDGKKLFKSVPSMYCTHLVCRHWLAYIHTPFIQDVIQDSLEEEWISFLV